MYTAYCGRTSHAGVLCVTVLGSKRSACWGCLVASWVACWLGRVALGLRRVTLGGTVAHLGLRGGLVWALGVASGSAVLHLLLGRGLRTDSLVSSKLCMPDCSALQFDQ